MSDFDSLLTGNTPEARELALRLRALLLETLPGVTEKVQPGWGVADYQLEGLRLGFLSIGPQKRWVNLYFLDGASMPDPSGLLTGAGKRMRHVKIRKPEDLANPALISLIRAAAGL